MSRNEKRRQKGLARRKKKRARKKQESSGASLFSHSHDATKALIRRAREFPVHECLLSAAWKERGLAQLVLSRLLPDDRIICGVYLADVYCLGLKNAFCDVVSAAMYERELKRKIFPEDNDEPAACSVELFHQIIYGAIDYARQFGFEPHRDFELAQHILDPRDQIPPNPDLEFGHEGKPLYISGPDDNVQRILRTLEKHAGDGNYDYMIGGPVENLSDSFGRGEDTTTSSLGASPHTRFPTVQTDPNRASENADRRTTV